MKEILIVQAILLQTAGSFELRRSCDCQRLQIAFPGIEFGARIAIAYYIASLAMRVRDLEITEKHHVSTVADAGHELVVANCLLDWRKAMGKVAVIPPRSAAPDSTQK